MLVLLAVAALVVSPATALSIIGVSQPTTGLTVLPPDSCLPAPQILSFTVTPTTISFGQSVTLSWNVQVPSGCNYLVALLGQSVGLKGSLQVQPVFDTSYTLTLSWGPTRSLYATAITPLVSVTVPTDPSNSNRNLITISSQQTVPMFVRALGTKNTTVIVNADLDLSGLPNIPSSESRILIVDGVRLVGGRTAVPGQPFQPGPLLSVTDHPKILFEVQGDNVRITGVRIQGSNMGESSSYLDTGLLLSDVKPGCVSQLPNGSWPTCPPIPGHINVEVDHSEFSGWSLAAVRVVDDHHSITVNSWIDGTSTPAAVAYALNTEPVWVHDNFIHHNQNLHGNGYGVSVDDGAHALIERNVFDYNRHAITEENGENDSQRLGYRAYRNLVLPNGGVNDSIEIAPDRYTHQFDMHGSLPQCVAYFSSGVYNTCLASVDHMLGPAGHDYDIRYNSFLYKSGPAIKLRGEPQLGLPGGAVVRFNVFAHDHDWLDAVKWTEVAPVVQDNLTGRTTYYGTRTCDFDGDGINDAFIATEQTLWYCPGPGDCTTAPGSGQPTWVYLNMSTKRVDQLSLGYFSGGRVCDVADGGLISVGGSGPWKLMMPSVRVQ
jgi:hypothetical protein